MAASALEVGLLLFLPLGGVVGAGIALIGTLRKRRWSTPALLICLGAPAASLVGISAAAHPD